VLQIVAMRDGVTPKELSAQMGVSQATVSTLLDRLSAKGMLRRERSSRDRRQTNVVLTDAGQEAVGRAPDALQQQYVRAFEGLEDWEQAMIVAALERVASMLNAADLDAAPVLDHGEIKRGPQAH
jgi:DNA-binding MarR family transcriptional regulator